MKVFISFLHLINFLLSLLMPKNRNIWLYGEWFGEKFQDNSSYAFKADSNRKGIRKIWITKNKKVYDLIQLEGYEVIMAHSLRGLFIQARAGVFFCSVNSKDFCFSSLTPRAIVVQMWHGVGLKKMGFDIEESKIKFFVNWIRSKTVDSYSYIVSPYEMFDDNFCSAFRVSKNKIVRSLYPRCDGLLHGSIDKSEFKKKLGITTEKIYFYMPTHRSEGREKEKFQKLIKNMFFLEGFLRENDITLIIKPHFYENGNYTLINDGYVRVIDDLGGSLYDCLSISDALITDYSSICFDYIVTGKPIYYFVPDVEEYLEDDRDFHLDYKELLINPCMDIDSLIKDMESRKSGSGMNLNDGDFLVGNGLSISNNFQLIMEEKVYGEY
ncbi:MAG: CDP-glycerol glycerophosphotransferase family protein [Paenalcaligenes sp.]